MLGIDEKKHNWSVENMFFPWNGLDYVFYKGSSFTIDFVLVVSCLPASWFCGSFFNHCFHFILMVRSLNFLPFSLPLISFDSTHHPSPNQYLPPLIDHRMNNFGNERELEKIKKKWIRLFNKTLLDPKGEEGNKNS